MHGVFLVAGAYLVYHVAKAKKLKKSLSGVEALPAPEKHITLEQFLEGRR